MSQVNINISTDAQKTTRPAMQLKTNRGLLKYIIFSALTLGIYPLVVMSVISTDINLIASSHDGRKTMHYCLLFFIVAPLTLGIGAIVWMHRLCDRIGFEAARRGIGRTFSAGTFWGWGVLGSFLFGIGPLVFFYKLLHTMNDLCADYNARG